MPPDLYLDPDALRAAAAAAAAIAHGMPLACLDELQVEACRHVAGGPEHVAEHDRILGVLRRVTQELAELAAAAAAAACRCEEADRQACRVVRRAGEGMA